MEFVQKNVCEPDIDEVKAALASVIKSKEAKNKDRVNSITLENRSSFDDGLQICTEDVADDEIQAGRRTKEKTQNFEASAVLLEAYWTDWSTALFTQFDIKLNEFPWILMGEGRKLLPNESGSDYDLAKRTTVVRRATRVTKELILKL